MNVSNHDRFKGADWYSEATSTKLIVGGAGGIGSWTTLALVRMGIECIVYDDDTYEVFNKSGQLVRTQDIGKKKVEALNDICFDFCDNGIYSYDERFTDESMSAKIMIAGFDSIASRRIFFNVWRNQNTMKSELLRPRHLFIDGRLEAEMYQIFAFTGDNIAAIDDYEQNQLFNDSEVEAGQCTLKQTSHTAMNIASTIASLVANFLINQKYRQKLRTIPYFSEFNSELMLYTQKLTP